LGAGRAGAYPRTPSNPAERPDILIARSQERKDLIAYFKQSAGK
jgi:hypothetical protein